MPNAATFATHRCLLLFAFAEAPSLRARRITTSLKGTIKDTNGAVIPNAAVTAANTGTRVVTALTTALLGRCHHTDRGHAAARALSLQNSLRRIVISSLGGYDLSSGSAYEILHSRLSWSRTDILREKTFVYARQREPAMEMVVIGSAARRCNGVVGELPEGKCKP